MSSRRRERSRELAVNAWLTARTIGQHVTDDPVVFWLQVSRRLPRRWVTPAARVLARLPGRRCLPARATAFHVLGDDDAARAALSRALASVGDPEAMTPDGGHRERMQPDRVRPGQPRPTTTPSTRARRGRNGAIAASLRGGAEVALSMGDTDLTAHILAAIPADHPGAAATRARLEWYHGNVDPAVEVLRDAEAHGRATRGERALARRLAAERDLLGDFFPRLEPVRDYRPRDRTMFYAVTNSLPHTASGYAQRSHSYLTALRDEGWDVHAMTRPGYPVQVGKVLARHTDVVDGIPYHRVLPRRLSATATGRVQQHAEALLELALRTRPAVLHTTSHYVNALAVHAVAQALGIPWVYEVRGLLADTWAATRPPEALTSERYERFQASEAWAVTTADRTVTLGSEMARRLEELTASASAFDIPLRVDLAPNAVGGALVETSPSWHDARAALGLAQETFLIGTVTSVVDYEGIDDLLRAAARLRRHIPSLGVLVVGDGVARPALQRLTRELGLEDVVTYTGRVDRTLAPQYTAALDVFVIPRKDRSVTRAVTPLKPVEAMAARTAVVASDLPALRETVRPGETGLLTPPEAPDTLAETLLGLARDPEHRERLANAGRDWVLAHRTWRVIAQQASTRYGELNEDVPRTATHPPRRPTHD
ncbi:glycosyltransferase family 4 protein [Kocuria marina]|uniref:glycosyltransferase family 4 protein n=1 Tax=Kocuria marina TaxID=223184 RepID=UPI0022E53515|nr:glycosyltransferase family 4 protein [Kocuria marina]